MEFTDYYKALDLPFGASPLEIKKAYKSLSLKHHPDLNRNSLKANAKQQSINEAYYTLSRSKRKAIYDIEYCINYKEPEKEQLSQQEPSCDNSNLYDSDRYRSDNDYSLRQILYFVLGIAFFVANIYRCTQENQRYQEPNHNIAEQAEKVSSIQSYFNTDVEFNVSEILSYLNKPFKAIKNDFQLKRIKVGKIKLDPETSYSEEELNSLRAQCKFSTDGKIIGFSETKFYSDYATLIKDIKKQGFKFLTGAIVIRNPPQNILLEKEPKTPMVGALLTYKRKDGFTCIIGRRNSENDFTTFNAEFSTN